jgi:hypothetical protein
MNRRQAAAAVILIVLPTSAMADVRGEVMAGMAQCSSIADDRVWLDCIYGSAQPMRAHLGLTPAPQWHGPVGPSAPGPGMPVPPPRDNKPDRLVEQSPPEFGLPVPSPAVAGIRERMVSYQFNTQHRFTVVLANGQVWQQLSGDTTDADWSKAASSYTVSISRGALSSYNLRVNGEGGSYKVVRIMTANKSRQD